MKKGAAKIGVDPGLLVTGVMFVIIFLVAVGVCGNLLVSIVGFLYPAYRSFKALESEDKADDTQWLTYWVVYAFFTVFDEMTSWILNLMPFYFMIKLVLMIWMFWPTTNGALVIYKSVLAPFLRKYQDKIDKHVGKAEQSFDDSLKFVKDKAPGAMAQAGAAAIQKMNEQKQ